MPRALLNKLRGPWIWGQAAVRAIKSVAVKRDAGVGKAMPGEPSKFEDRGDRSHRLDSRLEGPGPKIHKNLIFFGKLNPQIRFLFPLKKDIKSGKE